MITILLRIMSKVQWIFQTKDIAYHDRVRLEGNVGGESLLCVFERREAVCVSMSGKSTTADDVSAWARVMQPRLILRTRNLEQSEGTAARGVLQSDFDRKIP